MNAYLVFEPPPGLPAVDMETAAASGSVPHNAIPLLVGSRTLAEDIVKSRSPGFACFMLECSVDKVKH